jgi:hypothetical protein
MDVGLGMKRKGDPPRKTNWEEWEYTPKTDEEIKVLALDYMASHIFTSNDLGEDSDMITSVFVVLGMLPKEAMDKMLEQDITLFYEYLSKAGPMSCNGCPMFFSMQMLNKADHKRLADKVKEIKAKLDEI